MWWLSSFGFPWAQFIEMAAEVATCSHFCICAYLALFTFLSELPVVLHFMLKSYHLSSKALQDSSYHFCLSAFCDSCPALIRLQYYHLFFYSSVVTSLTAIWHGCHALPCLFCVWNTTFSSFKYFLSGSFPCVNHWEKENCSNMCERATFWAKSSLEPTYLPICYTLGIYF